MRRPLVLIVEDDPSVRRLVRLTLDDHPCRLVEADTGNKALHELAVQRPDLVLLDRGLPDFDGLDILATMRAHPDLQSVPVILLTARSTTVDVVAGLASGAFDYVAKPFEPAELAARVTVALRVTALTEELRQRNQDLSTFASRAAHDLKSPLTAIRGLAETLAARWERLPDETRNDLLRMISGSADRAATMVQDLLSLARYDVADGEAAGAADPEGILREVVAAAPVVPGDEVAVSGSFAGVAMPARDLTAVLTNLIENAAHYGRGDDGRLTLAVSGEVDGTRLRLRVEDRGTGIDPAEAGHIFDAFYRPASSLQRNPSSTGVGLAIVRRALERWHGTIEVVQAEPTGAAFIVDLPLAVPLPWGAGGSRGGRV